MSVTTDLRKAQANNKAVLLELKGGSLYGPDGTIAVVDVSKTGVTLEGDKGVTYRVSLKSIQTVTVWAIQPYRTRSRRFAR